MPPPPLPPHIHGEVHTCNLQGWNKQMSQKSCLMPPKVAFKFFAHLLTLSFCECHHILMTAVHISSPGAIWMVKFKPNLHLGVIIWPSCAPENIQSDINSSKRDAAKSVHYNTQTYGGFRLNYKHKHWVS